MLKFLAKENNKVLAVALQNHHAWGILVGKVKSVLMVGVSN